MTHIVKDAAHKIEGPKDVDRWVLGIYKHEVEANQLNQESTP